MKPPNEDFLATVLPKMCRLVELKNSEIRKNRDIFIMKAIRPQDVP